ncbi:MAG: competence protein ComEC, partial [Cyanobacteria bacterium K_DeepCast_35m_m2_023]|nr:competence protein ComEC [Cyanobacteria bacterium K_DeepCast_35m_m2_023]
MGPKVKSLLLAVLLILVVGRAALESLQPAGPGPGDPARWLHGPQERRELRLRGVLMDDPRPSPPTEACRALLQLERGSGTGRVELRFAPCPTLQRGWRIAVTGLL